MLMGTGTVETEMETEVEAKAETMHIAIMKIAIMKIAMLPRIISMTANGMGYALIRAKRTVLAYTCMMEAVDIAKTVRI